MFTGLRLTKTALTIGFLWVGIPSLGSEPVNLLTDGGFEQGASEWEPDALHKVLSDRKSAHSGTACLTGSTTRPNQALRLRRTVRVHTGRRYEFIAWARATNRAKMVLFTAQHGIRKSVATWKDVPRRWHKFSVAFTVKEDGVLQLELITPSSYGAPIGTIWIDDLALYETAMPALTSVSGGVGFNDEPAMAAASDGSWYVAWNSFRHDADSLQLAHYQAQGKNLIRQASWQIVGGPGTYVLGPRVVPADENVLLVYAAEVHKNWDIYAVRCGPDGAEPPIAVTSDTGVDVKPAAVWCGGTLWVTWESNRNGFRQIFVSSVRDGQVSKAIALSDSDCSSYAPTIAAPNRRDIDVAWYSSRQNNMDVYLSRRVRGGSWQAPVRLTHAPSIDRHPVLFTRRDEVWLIYENSQTTKYYVGRSSGRHLILAQVTDEGLLTPQITSGKSPLDGHCEGASATFDPSGRLWVTYLTPRLPRAGWDTFITSFANGHWQRPTVISSQKGMDRRPGLARIGDLAVVAFQSDDSPRSWSDLDQMARAVSSVHLAVLPADASETVSRIKLTPLVESEAPFEPAQLHVALGENTPTPTIQYNGQELKLLYGSLHEHSDVSICNRVGDESIDENYQSMRDLTHHDFACLTDHGYNLNPYLWNYTAKLVRVNNDPGRFVTFLAEEWTSTFEEYSEAHPYGFYGHRNLILADPYFPRWWNARNRQTPAEVWEDLRKMNANFIHIPHQLADTGNVPTDWNFHDEVAQPAAEIFQTRGSYEFRGTVREAKRTTPKPGYFLQDAWARGIVIGVIASPDHGGGYGKACVFAPEATREAILDGIRARRCYGTTGAKIFLDVRVNGHLMGEKVREPAGKKVDVNIVARCPDKINRIEVCRNNRFIYTSNPDSQNARLHMVDSEPLDGRSYYYVRVVQEDQEIAWSSPVWFGAE